MRRAGVRLVGEEKRGAEQCISRHIQARSVFSGLRRHTHLAPRLGILCDKTTAGGAMSARPPTCTNLKSSQVTSRVGGAPRCPVAHVFCFLGHPIIEPSSCGLRSRLSTNVRQRPCTHRKSRSTHPLPVLPHAKVFLYSLTSSSFFLGSAAFWPSLLRSLPCSTGTASLDGSTW